MESTVAPKARYVFQEMTVQTTVRARPFVKWVGGKSQLLKQLKMHLPSKAFNSYFEPFFGGGAMFFSLSPHVAHINDVNKTLMTAYSEIKRNPRKIISELKGLQAEYYARSEKGKKDLYLEVRKEYNELSLGSFKRAVYLIFLNKTCYNGLYRENSKGGFNVPFGKYKTPKIVDEENILAISKLLKNTEITCTDFKEAVQNAKRGDFVYFDPPYHPLNGTSKFTDYSGNGFTEKDQERLKNLFADLAKRGCFVMLSNSNTRFIRELYRNYKIVEVKASRAINCKGNKRGKIKELVILSY